MHRRHKYDIIIVLSLLGFGVSIYLAVTKYLGLNVPCSITGGCEDVLSSRYASLFGIPLAVWGVAYFTGVILAALLANHYAVWRKALTILLSAGALAAAVFLVLQFFVLKKVCQYCLVTDVLAIVLLLLDINIEHKKP